KDPDRIPKPRPSRVRSGKPTAPPPETAAGTPQVRTRGKAGRRAAESTAAPETHTPGMAEAPQSTYDTLRAIAFPSAPGEESPSRPSYDGETGHRPLPALRQQGPRPPFGGEALGKYLDALLAKPEQRSERAREILQSQ